MFMWHYHGTAIARVQPNESRLNARWLSTVRPNQSTWAMSPPVSCDHPYPPLPFTELSLNLKADIHFTVQKRVESWVKPGTTAHAEGCTSNTVQQTQLHTMGFDPGICHTTFTRSLTPARTPRNTQCTHQHKSQIIVVLRFITQLLNSSWNEATTMTYWL